MFFLQQSRSIFIMFSNKYTLAFLAIGAASVNAFTGTAYLAVAPRPPTIACPLVCPPSDIQPGVGVAPDKITEGRAHCCDTVAIAYGGHNIQARITGVCPSCHGSDNITLSTEVFQQIADPALGQIYPVVWNVLG
ncbi:hypothetical protein E1B28_011580 [Marasmius oreades]|uniref:RlpA-like protein double-psi beta-barrel domain-containing protein n=1 Tax=Marasmius oreades TaxID=181124 RepID=A0A9P7RUK1_9AGAR|nr:uncharacterized protein E1B28_011580 [Marasmius oreades]KAG7089955.1 hypothetical protein E1B28_011580 [Marasmius oreades]